MPHLHPTPRDLFTYGSLLCEDIFTSVVGAQLGFTAALLPGYRRFLVRDEKYPGVIAAEGGSVAGRVYHEIAPEGWARLDRFEGEMYDRVSVTVRYESGIEAQVFCYVFRPQFQHRLTTVLWDFDAFLRNGKHIFQSHYSGFKVID